MQGYSFVPRWDNLTSHRRILVRVTQDDSLSLAVNKRMQVSLSHLSWRNYPKRSSQRASKSNRKPGITRGTNRLSGRADGRSYALAQLIQGACVHIKQIGNDKED